MKEDKTFGEIIRSHINEATGRDYFFIGKYQRSLAWGKVQWDDFINSIKMILTKERKKINLGNVCIYCPDNEKHIYLPDTQQRFTAIALFSLACNTFMMSKRQELVKKIMERDSCSLEVAENLINDKYTTASILYKHVKSSVSIPILKYSDDETNIVFQNLIKDTSNTRINYTEKVLVKEFNYFYDFITLDNVLNIISILHGDVSTNYGFFGTLNTCESFQESLDYFYNQDKGVNLSPADRVHTILYENINKFYKDDKVTKESHEDFLFDRIKSELNVDEMSRFYQLFIYYKTLENIQNTQKLTIWYENKCNSIKNRGGFESFIHKMKEFYEYYIQILNRKINKAEIKALIPYNDFKMNRGLFVWHTVVEIIRNIENLKKDDIEKTMDLCYSLILRRKMDKINSGSDNASIKLVENALKRKNDKISYSQALSLEARDRYNNESMDDNIFYEKMKKYDFYKDKDHSLEYLLFIWEKKLCGD